MISEERYELINKKCFDKGYTLLTGRDDIHNNQSYVTYICPLHGEYTTRVTSIIQGKSCYKCSRTTALKGRQIDYVLGQFPPDDLATIEQKADTACELVKSFATIGIERTMNFFNTKK